MVRRISTRERPTSKLNKKEVDCRKDNLYSGIASTSTCESKSRYPFSMRNARKLRPMSVYSEPVFRYKNMVNCLNSTEMIIYNKTKGLYIDYGISKEREARFNDFMNNYLVSRQNLRI